MKLICYCIFEQRRALSPLVDTSGHAIPLYGRRGSSPGSTATPALLSAFSPTPPTASRSPAIVDKNHPISPDSTRQPVRAKSPTVFQTQSKHRRRRSGDPKRSLSPRLGSPSSLELREFSGAPKVVTITPKNGYHLKRTSSTGTASPPPHRSSPVAPGRVAAIVSPKPRVSSGPARARSPPNPGSKGKARQSARALRFQDGDNEVECLANGDASSVRRVLRENEASRREREEWSDSSAGGPLSAWADRRRASKGRRASGDENAKPRRSSSHKQSSSGSHRGGCTSSAGETDVEPWHAVRSNQPDYSPPVPHSFAPFQGFARKLSLGRGHERSGNSIQALLGLGLGGLTGSKSATNLREQAAPPREPPRQRQRSASVSWVVNTHTHAHAHTPSTDSGHRYIGDRAIRHLVRSPSLDSLYQREQAANAPRVPSQYGEALLPSDQTALAASPRQVDRRQNAFVTLPPSLHHLLRAPSPTFLPQRAPPPIPFAAPYGSSLGAGAKRLPSSDSQSSHLVIAFGSSLSREADERDRRLTAPTAGAAADPASDKATSLTVPVGFYQGKPDGSGSASANWRERRAAALEGQNSGGQPMIGRRTSSLGLQSAGGKLLGPDGRSGINSVAWSSVGDLSASNVNRTAATAATAAPAGSLSYASHRSSPTPIDADPVRLLRKSSIEPVRSALAGAGSTQGHHKRGSSLSTVVPLSAAAAAINNSRGERTPPARSTQSSPAPSSVPIVLGAALTRDDTFGPHAPLELEPESVPIFPSRSTTTFATAHDEPFGPTASTVTARPSTETARPSLSLGASQRSGSSGETGSGGHVDDLGEDYSPSFSTLFFRPPPANPRIRGARHPALRLSDADAETSYRFSRSTFASDDGPLTHFSGSAGEDLRLGTVGGAGAVQMERGPSTDSQAAELQWQCQLAAEEDATFGPERMSAGGLEEITQASLDALFAQHGYTVGMDSEGDEDYLGEGEGEGGRWAEPSSTAHSTAYSVYETATDGDENTTGVVEGERGSSSDEPSPVLVQVARFEPLEPARPATLSVYSSSSHDQRGSSSTIARRPSLRPSRLPGEAESSIAGSSYVSEYHSAGATPTSSANASFELPPLSSVPMTAPVATQAWSFLDVDGEPQEVRFIVPEVVGRREARSAPAGGIGFAVTGEAPVRVEGEGSTLGLGVSSLPGSEREQVVSPVGSFLDWEDEDGSAAEASSGSPSRYQARKRERSSSRSPLTPPPVVLSPAPDEDKFADAQPSPQTVPDSPAFRSTFFDSDQDEDGRSGALFPYPDGRQPSSHLGVEGARQLVFPGPPRSPKSPRRPGQQRPVPNRASGLSVASSGSRALEGLDQFPRPPGEEQEREELEEERGAGGEDQDDGTATIVPTDEPGPARAKLDRRGSSASLTTQILLAAAPSPSGSSNGSDASGREEAAFSSGRVPFPRAAPAPAHARYPPRHDSLPPGRRGHAAQQPSAGSFLDFDEAEASSERAGEGEREVSARALGGRQSVGSFATFFSGGPGVDRGGK